MQPQQQTEQLFREMLATPVYPGSNHKTLVIQINTLELVLTTVFGYTKEQISDIVEEVHNQQNA